MFFTIQGAVHIYVHSTDNSLLNKGLCLHGGDTDTPPIRVYSQVCVSCISGPRIAQPPATSSSPPSGVHSLHTESGCDGRFRQTASEGRNVTGVRVWMPGIFRMFLWQGSGPDMQGSACAIPGISPPRRNSRINMENTLTKLRKISILRQIYQTETEPFSHRCTRPSPNPIWMPIFRSRTSQPSPCFRGDFQ